MIDIDSNIKEYLLNNSVHREIMLDFPELNLQIGSGNIISESFELTQSINDQSEFKLGGGLPGEMVVQIIDISDNLSGRRVNVFLTQTYSKERLLPSAGLLPSSSLLIGEPTETITVQIFSGRVFSAKKEQNRQIRKIIAYDDFYDLSQYTLSLNSLTNYVDRRGSSGTEKYYSTLDFINYVIENSTTDVENLTSDCFDQNVDVIARNLSNFGASITFTKELMQQCARDGMIALDVLTAYAELCAAFARIKGDGSVCFQTLLKSSRAKTSKKDVDEIITYYHSLSFEEFITKPITYVRFQIADTINYAYGINKEKSCYLSSNIILRCAKYDNLSRQFVTRLNDNQGCNFIFYDLLSYRPYKANVFGRWWLEPGDRIQIQTGHDDVPVVDSFVFSRKIKGINGMSVTIEAKGIEYLGKKEVEKDG